MSSMAKRAALLCSCCGGEGCPNGTGCSSALTLCTGARILNPALTEADATISGSQSVFTEFSFDTSSAVGFIYFSSIAVFPMIQTIEAAYWPDWAWSVTLSNPTALSMLDALTVKSGTGIYRRYVVNGETMLFDTLASVGVAKTSTITANTQPAGLSAGYTYNSSPTVERELTARSVTHTFTALREIEQWDATVRIVATADSITHTASITGMIDRLGQLDSLYNRKVTTTRSFTPPTPDEVSTEETQDAFKRWHNHAAGIGSSPYITTSAGFLTGGEESPTCEGDELSWTYAAEAYPWTHILSTLWTHPAAIESSTGSGAGALQASFTESEVGSRGADRALEVSGAITDNIVKADTFAIYWEFSEFDEETYPDGPSIGDGLAVAELTVAGRLVQASALECGNYPGLWTGTLTLNAGGDDYTASATLTRIGPELYTLYIEAPRNGNGSPFLFYLKFTEHPTGAATVCQEINPHTQSGGGSDGGFVVDPDPLSQSTGLGTLADIPDLELTLDAGYSGTFTSHAFTFTASDPEPGDPEYFCDE